MLALILSPFYVAIIYWVCRRWYKFISALNIKNKRLDFWLKHFSWSMFLLTIFIGLAFILPEDNFLRRPLFKIGAYWLGISLYLILYVALIDLLRWIYSKVFKDKYNDFYARTICALLIIVLTGVTSIYGIINAKIVRTTEYEITINKDGGNFKEMTIAMFGDPQFGYNIGEYHLKQAVDIINKNDVDIVCVVGDIFDNQYSAIKNPDKLIDLFNQIKSKYGMYAVLGNHDVEEPILCGFTFNDDDIKNKLASKEMLDFIRKSGMVLLYDENVIINNSVNLYGRADQERPNLGNITRKESGDLFKEVDVSKPIMVLDHEPREYDELEKAGVDLMMAGHTHDGQLLPTKIATDIIWENPYGLWVKNAFHAITTSGLGLFGPNMRVGTIAEVCIIHVKFR
ncbi:MAG: metallophosphoesterase [Solobacterium sp.]|nr:metallophosphoesterase [Solobacterium sp.]MDY2952222.1 metallophosphoesterase [Erysipelotrichaceae bacterium]MCI6696508.1 metallophosphoesterase [Solobacterium sp.]MCI6846699.1 metallophosphoesterase [Solobacterium sp.]MCI6878259.1 metallophosphoesterase [Solobacterium sp.]